MMMNRLKRLNEQVLSFMTRNIAKIMGVVVAAVLSLYAFSYVHYSRPETAADFANVSVMIVNLAENSGGSGVILSSSPFRSRILTNKHICRIIEKGGYVIHNGQEFMVDTYKKYPKHDLCLITVIYDLGVNTKVASHRPANFSEVNVTGHPGLMPPVLTKGYFSGRERIQLITGLKKCTEKTPIRYRIYCLFFGGLPIVESFDAQLVTATISPGSSGSGVFNKEGELSGLVFAGRGKGLGYGYIVPHEYIVNFLREEKHIKAKRAGMGYNYKDFFQRIFNFQNKCQQHDVKFKNLCNYVETYLIWNI